MGSFGLGERVALVSRGVLGEVGRGSDGLVEEFGALDPLNQALMMDMRLYLENDILVKLDRASMTASLEGRVPLLNRDFVEFATALPMNLKLRGLRSKYLFKRALRGILPERILNRPKKGFGIPVAHWFRGPLRDQLLTVLGPERLRREGLFDPAAV